MPVYNAAIPILEAYMQGAKLKLAQEQQAQEGERAKERAQLLRDQLKAQADHYKQIEEAQKGANLLAQGRNTLEKVKAAREIMKEGGLQEQTYRQPGMVAPTGIQVPAGSLTVGAQEGGLTPGGEPIETPPLMEVPLTAALPQDQGGAVAMKPDARFMGEDISMLPTTDRMREVAIAGKGAEAEAITAGQERAKIPGELSKRKHDIKLEDIKAENKAAETRSHEVWQEGYQNARLDRQEAWQNAKLEFEKTQAGERNEIARERNSIAFERNNIARKKLDAVVGGAKSFETLIPDLKKGVITHETLKAEDKATEAAIRQMARDKDVVILTNKQVSDLSNMQVIRNFYEKAKELEKLVANSSRTNPVDQYRVNEARKQMLAILEPVAKGIGYKGAITNDEQTRLENLIPGFLGDATTNKQRVKSLKGFIDEKVDSIIPDFHFKSEGRKLQRSGLKQGFNVLIPDEE